jgi:hypothetical protein
MDSAGIAGTRNNIPACDQNKGSLDISSDRSRDTKSLYVKTPFVFVRKVFFEELSLRRLAAKISWALQVMHIESKGKSMIQ